MPLVRSIIVRIFGVDKHSVSSWVRLSNSVENGGYRRVTGRSRMESSDTSWFDVTWRLLQMGARSRSE